jgi:uncharacterized membrane protein YuzA (DUF378 family)
VSARSAFVRVHDGTSSILAAWSNFYVIVGSSSAALTGLTFVVITLIAGERSASSEEGIATFTSPTVVHFCVPFVVSTVLSAPWTSLTYAGTIVGLAGLYGAVYVARATRRTARFREYQVDVEDWTWYSILPFISYCALIAVPIVLPTAPANALFALAGATVLLILVGIHNAWDVTTYLVVHPQQPSGSDRDEKR